MFWKKKVYNVVTVSGLKPGDRVFIIHREKEIKECRIKRIEYKTCCYPTWYEFLTYIEYEYPTAFQGKTFVHSCKQSIDTIQGIYKTLEDCMNRKPMPHELLDVGKYLEQDGWKIERKWTDDDLLCHYRWDGVGAVKDTHSMGSLRIFVAPDGIQVEGAAKRLYKSRKECEKFNGIKVVRLKP